MKISACLIVKDSEATIERCLDSIRPFVDEVCIYDTGSTDATFEILERMNERTTVYVVDGKLTDEPPEEEAQTLPLAPIRVERGEWRNDFAWAREQSFKMAPDADWHFWLDDDDVIIGAESLRALAVTAHPALDGFIVYYDYARDEAGNVVCELWRERLLRNNGKFKWQEPVHEVYVPQEGLAPANLMRVPPEQLRFVHMRAEDRYSPTRNLEILAQHAFVQMQEKGRVDLRTQAYLGTEKVSQGDLAGAIQHFAQYLEDDESTVGDERSQVAHRYAMCAAQTGNLMAAIEIEFTAIKERDDWAENAIGLAEFFAQSGEWKRVEIWAKRALELGKPETMLIVNPIEHLFVPYMRLAEACGAQDRWDEARQWFEKGAALFPAHPLIGQKAMALEHDAMASKTVAAVLQLRETLVRFDENWKAYQLLQNVPYFIADDPRIAAARAMQTENVMHALKPAEYRRWYEDEPKESTISDEYVENVGEMIPRAQMLLEQCQAFEETHGRKPRVLDMGCNDAWMACWLWVKGEYVMDGVELNKASVEKGRERLRRFGAPGEIVQGNINEAFYLLDEAGLETEYDVISMFEVYEHVPDVNETLAVLEMLCSNDGVICITTPNGAFDQGNVPMWHIVERKGHLRAVPWREFCETIANRDGRLEFLSVHQNNRLSFVAYRPGPPRKKVILHGAGAWEPWSPASIRTTGIGGSETALTQLACRLAYNHDLDVRVFTDAEPGLYARSLWMPTSCFDPTEEADVFISSRNPGVFGVDIHAPVRALWCHDTLYPVSAAQWANLTDVICLSDWQRGMWEEAFPEQADKLRVIRNGIALGSMDGEDFFPNRDRPWDDRKPRVVYSSSADRGLDRMLELWPEIREEVEDAELHVFYGWDTFDRVARLRPELREYRAKIEMLLEALGGEEGGVFMRGRLPQPELYREFQEARVWGYPTNFMETSCITAMEVRAAGCAVVTSDLAALSETVSDEHGLLIPWGEEEGNEAASYESGFVSRVVDLLSDEGFWTNWHRRALDGVEELSWDRRVEDWVSALIGQEVLA